MKKMRIIPLTTAAVIASLSGIVAMNAQTFTENDIIEFAKVENVEGAYNNVYIIGKHMFKNSISVEDIMDGSRTLGSDDPNIIYRRSNTGVWTNAMNGESVTAPTTFEIKVADYVELIDTEVTSKLEEIKTQVENANYVAKEYTEDSFKALTDAIAMPESSNEEKALKLEAMTKAVQGLTFTNYEALEKLLKECEAVVEADYTALSYKEFKASFDKAKTMSDSTYADIENKIAALTSVKGSLVNQVVNKTLLNAEIIKAEKITSENDYTKESWATFTRAKAEATKANSSATLQSEINTAKENLTIAMNGLVFEGQTKLDEAKDISSLIENDYTKESWKNLIDKIAETYGDEKTNAGVKAKTIAINEAKAALLTKDAFNAITMAKAEAKKITDRQANTSVTPKEYSDETLTALLEALALGETATSEKNATEMTLIKVDAINKAVSDMKFFNEEELENEIKRHESFVESDYTPESWAKYKEAFEEANSMIYTKNETVLAKIKELRAAASDNLVSIGTITEESLDNLSNAIDSEYVLDDEGFRTSEMKLKESEYDKNATWSTYKDALSRAEELEQQAKDYFDESKPNAVAPLQSEMSKAIDALIKAKSGLISNTTATAIKNLKDAFDALKANASQYTVESWNAYKTAVESEYKNESEARTVKTLIENAVKGLVFANQAELDSLKDISSLNKDDYTTDSWDALITAIKGTVDSEGVPTGEDENTFDKIDIKISRLKDARENLETKAHAKAVVDFNALVAAGYDTTNYTDADGAYANAIKLPDGKTANDLTLEELNAKIRDIQNALNNLKPKKYEELKSITESVNDLIVSDYTTDSYTTFINEFNNIMNTYDESTNTLIEAKINAIVKAMSKLTYKEVDVTELTSLVESLETEDGNNIYDESKYTTETYKVYTDALSNAKDFLALESDDEAKFQSAADKLLEDLNKAIDGLRRK